MKQFSQNPILTNSDMSMTPQLWARYVNVYRWPDYNGGRVDRYKIFDNPAKAIADIPRFRARPVYRLRIKWKPRLRDIYDKVAQLALMYAKGKEVSE